MRPALAFSGTAKRTVFILIPPRETVKSLQNLYEIAGKTPFFILAF